MSFFTDCAIHLLNLEMVTFNDWSGSTSKQSLLRGKFLVLLKLEFISKQKLACDLDIVNIIGVKARASVFHND